MATTRVSRADSVRDYPSGCVMCGHDVAYITDRVYESRDEAWYYERPRRVETLATPKPLCPSCAKGYGTPHSPRCRGCQ